MTPEYQRKQIAKACGFSRGGFGWFYPDGHSEAELPDYLNDLNAMHEAEKFLIWQGLDGQTSLYCEWLDRLSLPWNATAAQRAEAFLRTVREWEDE